MQICNEGGVMSIDATNWAWNAPVKTSPQRVILLSLADRAGEDHKCYPSNKRIAKDTVLNIKTVQKVVNELIELGLISDTGERKGHTKQVRVLQLIGVNSREDNKPNFGTAEQTQKRNNTKIGNDTDNGLVKDGQTNPNLEGNEPKNGIGNDPKIGIGNLPLNLLMNLSCEHDWIPEEKTLVEILKMKGQQRNLKLIFGLPDFEFQLGAFNAHYEYKEQTESSKHYAFANWITDKFEQHIKRNPDYTEIQNHQDNIPVEQPATQFKGVAKKFKGMDQ